MTNEVVTSARSCLSTVRSHRGGVAARIVERRLNRWREGALELEFPDGRTNRYGDPHAESVVRLRVKDWKFRALATAASGDALRVLL